MTLLPDNIESLDGLNTEEKIDLMYKYIQYMTEQLTWFTSAKKLGTIKKEHDEFEQHTRTEFASAALWIEDVEDLVYKVRGNSLEYREYPDNINGVRSTGLYRIPVNDPSKPIEDSNQWWLMHLEFGDTGTSVQMAGRVTYSQAHWYVRKRQGDNWSSWRELSLV